MNIERSILVSFLGNYLINTVAAALVALVPAGTSTGVFTPQYLTFIALAIVIVIGLTWWYMKGAPRTLKAGIIFGVVGFIVAIATAFVSGLSGVLLQTGSLATTMGVVPRFGPFLANWTTLALLLYWVVPAAVAGWYFSRGMQRPMM